jgi:hypothetical protein
VWNDSFGLQLGTYGPATENLKNHSIPAVVAFYSFLSFQTPILSVGGGPEIGYGGFSTTMAFELGPFSRDGRGARSAERTESPLGGVGGRSPLTGITVGAYARWFWPFVPAGNFTDDHRAHEFGIRLRRGMPYLQYGFNQQMNGLREFTFFGTELSAHAYHQLTIGALFDSSTL